MKTLKAKAGAFLARFNKDEAGAALVEYSLLIGMITVAVVATIVIVGGWVVAQWEALQAAIGL